ncbi:hypothetical protein QM480_04955 [Flectobacillus sp. DC10W]|uniref:DUF5673 domain-containing protein n=1 Tax=Flectobacillus longus TaxID=2984207 RepID=A0ABT6YJA1_9BACT|nr:hypothetical protein [Flectobacillus longus]MDI9863660.1 hypothetical protein [Flectobacillus longus]
MKKKRKPTKYFPPLPQKSINILRILDGLTFILVFITILTCLEIKQMDQIFFGGTLFVIFLVVGLILGYQTIYYIKERTPLLSHPMAQKNFFLKNLFFLFLIGTPSLASFYNRTFPFNSTTCAIFPILEKGQSSRTPSSYFIYFQYQNQKERLSINKDMWMAIKENQPMEICIAKGGLGFEFVKEIYFVHE